MRFAARKDLRRHMFAKHCLGSTDKRVCPFEGCLYEQREDNVSRHHQLVHGVKIAWKRGVVYYP